MTSIATQAGPDTASQASPIVDVRRLVADGRHNAFTDLFRWRGQLYLTYRRSSGHGQSDGDVVLLRSVDGRDWRTQPTAFSGSRNFYEGHMVELDDRLLMFGASYGRSAPRDLATRAHSVSISDDGETWSEPQQVYQPLWTFWRPICVDGVLYTAAYRVDYAGLEDDGLIPAEYWTVKLLRSEDGLDWREVSIISAGEGGNETQLFADADGRLHAYIRREVLPGHLIEKVSQPPYTHWSEPRDRGAIIHGQNVQEVDGRRFMVGRYRPATDRYGTMFERRDQIVTKVWVLEHDFWVDYATLPSGGDCSYAGIAADPANPGRMWISYYSQHAYLDQPGFEDMESASDIYLAQLRTDAPADWGRMATVGQRALMGQE